MSHRITASDLASAQHVLQHAIERDAVARRKGAASRGDQGEPGSRGRNRAYPRDEDLGFGTPPSPGAATAASADA